MSTLLRAEYFVYRNIIGLALIKKDADGRRFVGAPVELNEIHPDAHIVENTLDLDMKGAQVLMDDLWRCGIRPTEGAGSAGSLAATERHLADLQKIVFGHLKLGD